MPELVISYNELTLDFLTEIVLIFQRLDGALVLKFNAVKFKIDFLLAANTFH